MLFLSQPRPATIHEFLLAALAYPHARALQRRFARDFLRAMREVVSREDWQRG